jgi:GTP-binding protein YchF
MSLSCGLVGLPSCGKTVVFNAITAASVSSYDGSEMNRAVVKLPDRRLEKLIEMYHPRKEVQATLEIVDIPGLEVGPQGNGRGSRLLGYIKDVEAVVHVLRCFEYGSDSSGDESADPVRDIETLDLELMVADSATLEKKMDRLEKRVRGRDKDAIQEFADCEKVHADVERGIPVRKQDLNALEMASIRECNLVSLKPVMYVANIKSREDVSNRHVASLRQFADAENAEMITIFGKDEADISELEPGEQSEFLQELGLEESSRERLLRAAHRMLGVVNFFTTGEDEVRAWTCRKGDKAPVAAGKIHTDMEKGFIRMEVISYTDLMELGSEAAVAKAGRQHVEGREYEVQDGDIVAVLFNR